jgi:hypothetical protein
MPEFTIKEYLVLARMHKSFITIIPNSLLDPKTISFYLNNKVNALNKRKVPINGYTVNECPSDSN